MLAELATEGKMLKVVNQGTQATIRTQKDLRARKVRTEARQDRVLIKMARARPALATPTPGTKTLSLVKYQKRTSSRASQGPRYARPRHEDWIFTAPS